MKMDKAIPEIMLAPCGMNCHVCYVHLKNKKACMGCHGADESKPQHCRACKIKACAVGHKVDFCFECPSFPCALVKRLDRSYRQRYQVSLIEGAMLHKSLGAKQYLLREREKWTCPDCGGVISLHDGVCSECAKEIQPGTFPPPGE
jgi:hypothetical protein